MVELRIIYSPKDKEWRIYTPDGAYLLTTDPVMLSAYIKGAMIDYAEVIRRAGECIPVDASPDVSL